MPSTYRATVKLTDLAHLAARGQIELVLPNGDSVLLQADSDVYRATERAATRQTIRRTLREGAARDAT